MHEQICREHQHAHERQGPTGTFLLVTLLIRNILTGVSQVLFLPEPTWFCKLFFPLELNYRLCYWLVHTARWNWSRSTASAHKPEEEEKERPLWYISLWKEDTNEWLVWNTESQDEIWMDLGNMMALTESDSDDEKRGWEWGAFLYLYHMTG